MICGACFAPAAVEITPVLHLCERCERVLRREFPNLSFLSAQTPAETSGGLTAALGVPPMVEAAAIIPIPVGATPAQEDRLALSPPAHPVRGPVTNSDITIPGFLRRDSENLAAWMRES